MIPSIASVRSKGLTAMSPASATCWAPNGCVCSAGWYGRSSLLLARTCPGPNRAPGRYETPESNGTPTIATSTASSPPACSSVGRRANVAGPANRGTVVASGGPIGSSGPRWVFGRSLGVDTGCPFRSGAACPARRTP